MNFCIIHGSPRKGNTYIATEILKTELNYLGDNNIFTEFFLPKAMPSFCMGCYNCFLKGEDKCPHFQYVKPIVAALREADGLIFTSPTYVLGETAQMKALLDHLGYLFMPHRPMEEMFSKVAFVLSTTAGAGTKNVIKAISKNLTYWGVAKVHKCGLTMHALNWDEMKEAKKKRYNAILKNKAERYFNDVKNRNHLRGSIKRMGIFNFMKKLISSYDDNNLDKKYWLTKGWLKDSRPF